MSTGVAKTAKAELVRLRCARLFMSVVDAIKTFDAATDQPTITTYKVQLEQTYSNYEEAYTTSESLLASAGNAGRADDANALLDELVGLQTAYTGAQVILARYSDEVAQEDDELSQHEENARPPAPAFKMPPIKLKTFSGKLTDWVEFCVTCESVLTDSIPEAHRFQYLKNSLEGEPADMIKFIAPTPGAFTTAFDLLKRRYQNKRAIVNSHLQAFFDLQKTNESISSLKALLNVTNQLTEALKHNDIDTNTWDAWLVYFLTQRLDAANLRYWEDKLNGSRDIPALTTFIEFLETRITIVETTASYQCNNKAANKPNAQPNRQKPLDNRIPIKAGASFLNIESRFNCFICQNKHFAVKCPELVRASPAERKVILDKNSLCENCFHPHKVEDCPISSCCKKCNGKHHTMLHDDHQIILLNSTDADEGKIGTETDYIDEDLLLASQYQEYFFCTNTQKHIILATAVVPVSCDGRSVVLKALIDPGSTANLLTDRACQLLQLNKSPANIPLYGVGNVKTGDIRERVQCDIGSIHEKGFKLRIDALIVNSITDIKPVVVKQKRQWEHLKHLQLADKHFNNFSRIDLLIGAGTYGQILLNGLVKGNDFEPIAQATRFGWIVSGQASKIEEKQVNCHLTAADDTLNDQLKRFWEIEEVEQKRNLSVDEERAEEIFTKSLKRHSDGKFLVDLPFKENPDESFGESKPMAAKRYAAIQRKFKRNQELQMKYDAALEEYIQLGHMELADENTRACYYLPHHPVIKEASSTTKIRPVFDGSAKSNNGRSLNDLLFVGATIQPDLFTHLIRWRRYKFAFTGDIEKMYRMVWVNPQHAEFQRILWQRPGDEAVRSYKLKTLTFGTSSAAFQAIRSLVQIGIEVENTKPEIAKQIKECFYVDDYLGSCESVEKAVAMRKQITELLAEYGLHLRKWKSSENKILEDLKDSEKETALNFNDTFKTLGIQWIPTEDAFTFSPTSSDAAKRWTKRSILSEIAKLFDPLGWMSPCVIKAKILMQSLWRLPLDWDTPVPAQIQKAWLKIYNQLCIPIPVKIPRWVGLSSSAKSIELHAFCDASNLAYATAVYIRIVQIDGNVACHLLASKTRVAPVKVVTIARLELCGAVLLTKLLKKTVKALDIPNIAQFAWTDSKIVLAWLAHHSSQWSTFIANRVSTIQQTLPPERWAHVPSKSNPADLASRGIYVSELANEKLWWHGPSFLMLEREQRPKVEHIVPFEALPEKRKKANLVFTISAEVNDTLHHFSNLERLLRFTVTAFRWSSRCKTNDSIALAEAAQYDVKQTHFGHPIQAIEITLAKNQWIRIVQNEFFADEIQRLTAHKEVKASSKLKNLNPFVDHQNILRMNGRVANEELALQKIAIILPGKHYFTELLIRDAHERTNHGGLQVTLQSLNEEYWIVQGRNAAKRIIHKCVTCFRFKKELLTQKMADLPKFRTKQARPFAFVGSDYCGYFHIKVSDRKNSPLSKAYIALFVCLCTKAIHLEVVPDLSTEEFLVALQNFIARRGMPTLFYSDNGGQYVKGEKEIHELHRQMFEQNNEITKMFAINQITFKRIPAVAPHMGGIWEAGVRSVKHHLRRVLGEEKLTYRRFDHVIKQIEATLNSRPLWAITSEGDDMQVLTPSHFFNFEAINTLPQPSIQHIPIGKLDQYQHLYRIYCSFWKLWSKEYLHQLQTRSKWTKTQDNVEKGQIVLVSEDNVPPSRWPLGRIEEVFRGKDGLVRIVKVKFNGAIRDRPIHKLALLPILDNNLSET